MKLKKLEGELSSPLPAADDLKSAKNKKHHVNQQKTNLKATNRTKIQIQLEDQLANCDAADTFEVIVQLSCDLKKDKEKVNKILGNSIVPDHFFSYINAFSAKLTDKQIKQLNLQQDVKLIEQNISIDANLDTANRWFGTEKARDDLNLSGSGITIAIVDTGIDSDHLDINDNKVIGWNDLVNGQSSPYDDQGHGTHVASIAAGSGDSNYRYKGVAPDASLVGVKVLDTNGAGSMTQIIQGVEWLIDHKDEYQIQIANLSLGSTGSSDGGDALSQAVNAAVDHGITVVVAAGNSGPNRYSIGTPAAAEKAITVGSMADVGERGYFLNLYSSRGPTSDGRNKPDISAPGHQITAAEANSADNYVAYSGTSMASPFVAGTLALILQINPDLTPDQLKNTLLESCEDWGKENENIDYGAGRLQGYEAIRSAGNLRGDLPTTPDHIQQSSHLQSTSDRELWQYQIGTLSYPVSITLIQENETNDFDLYVYDSKRRLIGYSNTVQRQEVVSFVPRSTGNYVIEIYSYRGKGAYYLDISGG